MLRQGASGGGWVSSPLLRETRGAVLVEYVTALALAIVIAAAILFAHGSVQAPSDALRRRALLQPYP